MTDDDTDPCLSLHRPRPSSSLSSSSLIGRWALITGGSGTIGKYIATTLAIDAGCSIIILGRNEQKLQDTAKQIKQELMDTKQTSRDNTIEETSKDENGSSRSRMGSEQAVDVRWMLCDVSSEEQVINLFRWLDEQDIVLDFLVNNAGVNVIGTTVDMSSVDFNYVMNVNVLGPFLCSKEFMKRYPILVNEQQQQQQEHTPSYEHGTGTSTVTGPGGAADRDRDHHGGKIINIGSLSSLSPRPDSAPYTTSKFALLGLTKSLSIDGRCRNVTCSIIHPGNVVSDLLTPDMIQSRSQTEGFLHPQDVANCVLTMIKLPQYAHILEMTLLPNKQPLVGRG